MDTICKLKPSEYKLMEMAQLAVKPGVTYQTCLKLWEAFNLGRQHERDARIEHNIQQAKEE